MAGRHSPADDNLLHVIAAKEKDLEAKVAQAKADAQRIVEEAQRQADAVREQARREATDLAARMQAEIAREAETLTSQRLAAAQTEAQQVRTRASERMRDAVQLVITRIRADVEPKATGPEPVGKPVPVDVLDEVPRSEKSHDR